MKKLIRWSPYDEADSESKQLIYLVQDGWDWNWPGWDWIARRLNEEFNNNRSANSCRLKYKKYLKSIELREHRK